MKDGISQNPALERSIDRITRALYYAQNNLAAARAEFKQISAILAADGEDRGGDPQPGDFSAAWTRQGAGQAE